MEHLENPRKVIEELVRISKPNAVIEIIVPHYTNKGAYNDIEHMHFFNENCFKELEEQKTRAKKKKFIKIQKIDLIPTGAGKFLPKKLREKLSLFINGLISQIHVKLVVEK